MSNPAAVLGMSFVVSCALIAWDEIAHQQHLPPMPQRFVGVAVAFGLLGILEPFAPPLAASIGFGLLVALAYQATSGGFGAAAQSDDTTTPTPSAQSGAVINPLNA